MNRKKLFYSCILLVLSVLLFAAPQTIRAEEKKTETTKEKEYDLNKKKTVTIKEKKSYKATKQYTWLKYTPSADGYLILTASDVEGTEAKARGYLALYDSTKSRLLSSKSIFYNTTHNENAYWYKFIFGLKEKQSYYIRIKADNAVSFSRQFVKTKDKSGIAQTTALNLKKNKEKKGLIPAGTTNTDWYQIKLTKKQKLRLYYQAKTNGSFRITVYLGKKKIGSRNIYYTSEPKKIVLYQYNKSTKKKSGMEPGIYHIKIERTNATSSGYYKIKWN